ncbi:MAG: hypothetical protein AB7I24_08260 [Candidatus Nanopelagicales bacterium]
MIPDTVLIDGTDIATLATLEDFSGVMAIAARRGSNYQVPGADGEYYTDKPLDSVGVPLPLTISCADPGTGVEPATAAGKVGQMWANYAALVALVKADASAADRTVVLTRRLSDLAGGTYDETCTAECRAGLTPVLTGSTALRVVVELINLDGTWTPE